MAAISGGDFRTISGYFRPTPRTCGARAGILGALSGPCQSLARSRYADARRAGLWAWSRRFRKPVAIQRSDSYWEQWPMALYRFLKNDLPPTDVPWVFSTQWSVRSS